MWEKISTSEKKRKKRTSLTLYRTRKKERAYLFLKKGCARIKPGREKRADFFFQIGRGEGEREGSPRLQRRGGEGAWSRKGKGVPESLPSGGGRRREVSSVTVLPEKKRIGFPGGEKVVTSPARAKKEKKREEEERFFFGKGRPKTNLPKKKTERPFASSTLREKRKRSEKLEPHCLIQQKNGRGALDIGKK